MRVSGSGYPAGQYSDLPIATRQENRLKSRTPAV